MRRMINNTTAIAACLSLLVPPMAQAQGAPTEGEQPPVPPAQEQQAETAAPEVESAPVESAAPEAAAETPAEPAVEATPEPESPAAEPEAEAATEPEAPAPEAPAADATAAPAPASQEAEAQAEPAEVPAQAEAPADSEGRSQRADERAERQAEQEQSTADAQAERPAEAPRQQDEEPPAAAQDARQQDQERPAPAAREQQADRPEPAPAEDSADPLRDALEAEQSPETDAAQAEPDQAQADAPAAPNQDDPRDVPAREQATPEAAAESQPPAADPSAQASETVPEADAPATEGAQQAAEETGAATAAALNDDQQGEVVEQQITEENSRSSSEDFATSLRDALAPEQAQTAQRSDDDDDNDLAKALLLGLGAVAVGTYLNNNRQVALSAPDRVVVTRADGSQEVIKDEVALLRQPGSTVATENFDDGSSRTVVTRADGSRVVTIRDADLRVLRRTLVSADGTQTRLIDDTAEVQPVDLSTLPAPAPVTATGVSQDEAALRAALQREVDIDRRFTLGQIRSIPQVRALVPPVTIDAITFDTGSAAISPDQARQLSALGNVIQDAIAKNPQEMFLIEGHTDTVGPDAANLALSDRRAESVALALTEYFQVPPENLVVQGYGEQFLQVRQEGDVRENRRAAVRRITDLLQTARAQ
ncbi:putative outer membrane lipoprotein [Paracoccus haematequi]|uniref:Putative outer membrane lipoprotein n=1 Tax=Paracoccus haematequi TaxID=2491866 RepID=A0A447II03_9RHOB|nr:OmpA family protein [Paracoccus haematequi]VDS07113.1 putative outer membrane lipoprotein [Paracoccus haematequi]